MRVYTFSCILLAVLLMTACKKKDQFYADYKNQLGVYDGNAYQYFAAQPPGVYDSMVKVINRFPGLKSAIQQDSLTIFALTNRSFILALDNINLARQNNSLPPLYLQDIDSLTLLQAIAKYFAKGVYQSTDLLRSSDGYTVPSTVFDYPMNMQYTSTNASGFLGGGPRSVLFSDTHYSLFTANWVRVNTTTVDIRAKNAIINILPGSHDFGFGSGFVNAVNWDLADYSGSYDASGHLTYYYNSDGSVGADYDFGPFTRTITKIGPSDYRVVEGISDWGSGDLLLHLNPDKTITLSGNLYGGSQAELSNYGGTSTFDPVSKTFVIKYKVMDGENYEIGTETLKLQ